MSKGALIFLQPKPCGIYLRITVILTVSVMILCFACGTRSTEKTSLRPNILVLMGDDHTTQAISCYGGHLAKFAQTKHIDQLAAEGIRFDAAFCTNAICSPARATLLTGLYSHRNGVRLLGDYFDTAQTNVAKEMRSHGYSTAVFGKWHLKSRPAGFDDFKVLQVQGRYQDPQFVEKGSTALVTREGWSTDVIADMTIDYLKAHHRPEPFFVMTNFKATHDPWASPPPYDTLFSKELISEPANLQDDYHSRSTAPKQTTLKLEQINQGTYPHERLPTDDWRKQRAFIYQQYIKDFLRCGRVLDDAIGRIIRALRETNQLDHTVIIYLADQGHFLGEHGFFSKRFMYEEAMRIPLIIRYPKLIDPGTTTDALVTNLDIAPTILDLAQATIPSHMQGTSIRPLLNGETPADWRKAIYYRYWQHLLHRNVPAHFGIRTREHKLIFFYGHALGLTNFEPTEPVFELYNLQADPGEMNNLYHAPEHEHIRQDLQKQVLALRDFYLDSDEQGLVMDSLINLYFKEIL